MKFSEVFGLKKSQAQLDFVDIDLASDTPLYIDPYALTTREDTWSVECHTCVVSFFAAVLSCVQNGNRKRGTELLSRLTEPEETRLGVSKGHSKGRGIGELQAGEVFDAMARSTAARSGLLEDLTDFALFVPGIGRDKISDMTTNIIRLPLIKYTQSQCALLGVPMREVASGFLWDINAEKWSQDYLYLPVHKEAKILLVPKFAVRYQVGVDATQYRREFVLEFLRAEHLQADDSLVTTLKNKKGEITSKKVFKKTVDAHYPTDKDFLAVFSKEHPEVINQYRESLKLAGSKIPDLMRGPIAESELAQHLLTELAAIPVGRDDADRYHELMIGTISFLFFPNLIYPKKEAPINQGRKRIDITYTNGKESGLFFRLALDPAIKANTIHIECKNYTSDIANEEFDQLLGRFDNNNRGRLGLLLFRGAEDMPKVIERARDAAKAGLGIVLPLHDEFISYLLNKIARGARAGIDADLDGLYRKIIS
jgi:hypothetical protein